jgi:hypothetical protein
LFRYDTMQAYDRLGYMFYRDETRGNAQKESADTGLNLDGAPTSMTGKPLVKVTDHNNTS